MIGEIFFFDALSEIQISNFNDDNDFAKRIEFKQLLKYSGLL